MARDFFSTVRGIKIGDIALMMGVGDPATVTAGQTIIDGTLYINAADWSVHKYETNAWAQKGSGINTAADLAYNNATSGLTATEIQAAIDELKVLVDAGGGGGTGGILIKGTWDMSPVSEGAEPVQSTKATVNVVDANNYEQTPVAPLDDYTGTVGTFIGSSRSDILFNTNNVSSARFRVNNADAGDTLVAFYFVISNKTTLADTITALVSPAPGDFAMTAFIQFDGTINGASVVDGVTQTQNAGGLGALVANDEVYFDYNWTTGAVTLQKNADPSFAFTNFDSTGSGNLYFYFAQGHSSATPTLLNGPINFDMSTTNAGRNGFQAGDINAVPPVGASDGDVYSVSVGGTFNSKVAEAGDLALFRSSVSDIFIFKAYDDVTRALEHAADSSFGTVYWYPAYTGSHPRIKSSWSDVVSAVSTNTATHTIEVIFENVLSNYAIPTGVWNLKNGVKIVGRCPALSGFSNTGKITMEDGSQLAGLNTLVLENLTLSIQSTVAQPIQAGYLSFKNVSVSSESGGSPLMGSGGAATRLYCNDLVHIGGTNTLNADTILFVYNLNSATIRVDAASITGASDVFLSGAGVNEFYVDWINGAYTGFTGNLSFNDTNSPIPSGNIRNTSTIAGEFIDTALENIVNNPLITKISNILPTFEDSVTLRGSATDNAGIPGAATKTGITTAFMLNGSGSPALMDIVSGTWTQVGNAYLGSSMYRACTLKTGIEPDVLIQTADNSPQILKLHYNSGTGNWEQVGTAQFISGLLGTSNSLHSLNENAVLISAQTASVGTSGFRILTFNSGTNTWSSQISVSNLWCSTVVLDRNLFAALINSTSSGIADTIRLYEYDGTSITQIGSDYSISPTIGRLEPIALDPRTIMVYSNGVGEVIRYDDSLQTWKKLTDVTFSNLLAMGCAFNGNEVILRGSAADGAGLYTIQTRLGGVYLP